MLNHYSFILSGSGDKCTITWNGDKPPCVQDFSKDIDRANDFLKSIERKLNNQAFLNNADPAVVAKEYQKKRDTEQLINSINELKEWHALVVENYKNKPCS